MDNNDLARFLDRAMSEEERGSTVAHLSESDADAGVVGDAAYLLRDLEGEDGVVVIDDDAAEDHPHADDVDTGTDPKVVPLRPPSTRRTWRRAPARWLALAAVLAGVLLVPLALSRSGSRDPGDFADLLANRGAGLPAGWDQRGWSVTRGEGNVVADTTLSAQLGALQVSLEVAAAASQADATTRLAGAIAGRLGDVQGSGPVAAAYRDIESRAQEPAETLVPSVTDARESLAAFVEEDYFNLGAWAQAATIAAKRRDAAFFHARASRKLLDRAASLPSLDDNTRATVEALRTAARADQLSWSVLETQTSTLLQQIGDRPANHDGPSLPGRAGQGP